MIKRMFLMLFIAGGIFGAVFGYRIVLGVMAGKMKGAGQMPPVTVSAIQVAASEWQPKVNSVGSVRAVRGVDIACEASGIVRDILFNSGDEVKEGQVLIHLNADTDQAQLRALKVSEDLARTVCERDKKQFAVQAISKAVLDADIADYKSKQALARRQMALTAQKAIKAPFAGRLGICMVNPGQYINPGDRLVTLQALDKVYVDFYLPQQDISKIQVGQTVNLLVDSYPGKMFSGTVSAIDPKIDRDTRNFQIEAVADNPAHALLPGMYVSVQVLSGEPKSYLTLPQAAVTFNPYGEVVYVIENNKAKQKFVVVGETRGDQVAVVSGLQEGETVVTSGQMKLKNGSAVVVNNDVAPSNESAPKVANEE